MNLRLEALRSRAGTAEKLLAEVRQTLAARTEDIRVLERKAVEANIARNATEKVVERLTTARDVLDGKVRELEQGRASLTERSTIPGGDAEGARDLACPRRAEDQVADRPHRRNRGRCWSLSGQDRTAHR